MKQLLNQNLRKKKMWSVRFLAVDQFDVRSRVCAQFVPHTHTLRSFHRDVTKWPCAQHSKLLTHSVLCEQSPAGSSSHFTSYRRRAGEQTSTHTPTRCELSIQRHIIDPLQTQTRACAITFYTHTHTQQHTHTHKSRFTNPWLPLPEWVNLHSDLQLAAERCQR